MTDQVYHPMSTQELIRHMQRYQSDSAHARSAEVRWLCTILQPVLDTACEVGNSRLSDENRKDLNAFRAVELEKQIETKRKDMEALERDLKKVRAA